MRFEIRRRPNFCFNAGLNKRKDEEGGSKGGWSLIINSTVVYERIERVKYAWDEVDQSFFLPWSPPHLPPAETAWDTAAQCRRQEHHKVLSGSKRFYFKNIILVTKTSLYTIHMAKT